MYNIGEELILDGILYKIIADRGLGFRKQALLCINTNTKEPVIMFYPSVTKIQNNINENKEKFIKDIDVLESLYKIHKDKCKIIPLYMSKEKYIIIIKYIEGGILYKYLSYS